MQAGGKNALSHVKAVLERSGVDKKCIAIFELVCEKAKEQGAFEISKDAYANMWI